MLRRISNTRRGLLRYASATALLGLTHSNAQQKQKKLSGHLVTKSFFGSMMHWPIRAPFATNYPSVPIASWRAISAEIHWFSLEPVPNQWDFRKLDIAVRLMENRGIDILFTLGYPPAWASTVPDKKGPFVFGELGAPKNIRDWENYIRTLAQRYKGKIKFYELWNEPKIKEIDGDAAPFTAKQLVELGIAAHKILKEIDPTAKLTTPSMVGGDKGVNRLRLFLEAGGKECSDIVSFHYYGLPEQIPEYHNKIRGVLADHGLLHLPVWNTEFGYLIEDPTTPNTHPLMGGSFSRVLPAEEAAIWLARSLIIAASVGIERFYWFMWDGKNMGLLTYKERRINQAGIAYGSVAAWLTDKTIGVLAKSDGATYCDVYAEADLVGRLIWSTNYQDTALKIPVEWGDVFVNRLDGTKEKHLSRGLLSISAAPVLVTFSVKGTS